MKIKSLSTFKDPIADAAFFLDWVERLQALNQCQYERIDLTTALEKTVVWGINIDKPALPALVIFPGFRTCSLFWDLDHGLAPLKDHWRIFLVDTNGQPCLSTGHTPDIKSDGYGVWAKEVLDLLGLERPVIAGASFGGLVCLKLALVAPDRVNKAILLNPGCLQPFSLTLKNLYYNFLPILKPTPQNITTFLDHAVFCPPHHHPSPEAKQMVVDYEVWALTRFIDKAQKPYTMQADELAQVSNDVYLLEGEKDLLFPYQRSLAQAKQHLKHLKEVIVLPNTGHGIEISPLAIHHIKTILESKPL